MCTETFCTGYEILAALSGGLKESADQRIEVSTTVYSEFKDSSTWNNPVDSDGTRKKVRCCNFGGDEQHYQIANSFTQPFLYPSWNLRAEACRRVEYTCKSLHLSEDIGGTIRLLTYLLNCFCYPPQVTTPIPVFRRSIDVSSS